MRPPAYILASLALATQLAACQSANQVALQIGKPPQSAVDLRSLQVRRFDTADEKVILSAATQTLQDLGYTISESASDAGVVTASKQRDAKEAGQVAGQIALTVFAAVMGVHHDPTWDQEQTIQVTVVSTPVANAKKIEVRTIFDRTLVNNHGIPWKVELVLDPPIYREFYEKLSKSAFLEARAI